MKSYDVKCDDCKRTIRETVDVRESYAGGTCDQCNNVRILRKEWPATAAEIKQFTPQGKD